MTRLRPEYKKVPEPALNATLNDLHDLVQYVVVQAQKLLYGEDLEKTFGVSFRETSPPIFPLSSNTNTNK